MTTISMRATGRRIRRIRNRTTELRRATRFPAIADIGVSSARFSFEYAYGTELHRTVASGWSYEQDVMSTLLTCLGNDDETLFVDVGANIGYFPIVVRKLLGERVRCVAYEPAPNLVATIRRGARLNGVVIDVRELAVGAEPGSATFYLSARSDASNSLNEGFRKHRGQLKVEVTTLDDDLLPSLPDQLPTRPMLLIDTETTEPDVLTGATNLIARHRPGIICEVLAGRTEAQIQEFVERHDYSSFALTDDGPEQRDQIEGDATYAHRDWLLWPAEDNPPIEAIRATQTSLRAATGHSHA